ncbi:mitochondrial carrier [Tilletiaria anomala UBC 951]|uniref:Mitochondrial carrier n=1 Tax=Tilletiaria anomala (strain ATCC 24038 / CBS 436.72 / UBC 951) TaxID=1037660 RepID=A0A066VLA2_TILAU|nr:mitochondrial carrier [Tilletiaria anomala UBC 951]KDN42517.1 mitochondrial carrier [Tilletiaria anomala UBC 951]
MAAVTAVGLQIATGVLITYPWEVIETTYKVTYQPKRSDQAVADEKTSNLATVSKYTNSWNVASRIVQKEGYLGLLRGLLPSFTLTALYSFSLDLLSQAAFQTIQVNTPFQFLILRESTTAFTRAAFSPLTTLVTRFIARPEARRVVPGPLAFHPGAIYRACTSDAESGADAGKSGSLKALYTYNPRVMLLEASASLTAGLANSLLVPPLVQLLYTFGSGSFLQLNSEGWQQVGMLACVASTGVLARLVNLALDTVSKRLQVQASHGSDDGIVCLRPMPYRGIRNAFARIVEEEGATSLFRGCGLYALSSTTLAGLSVLVAVAEGQV